MDTDSSESLRHVRTAAAVGTHQLPESSTVSLHQSANRSSTPMKPRTGDPEETRTYEEKKTRVEEEYRRTNNPDNISVDTFIESYFKPKQWTSKAKAILEALKTSYDSQLGRWMDLPASAGDGKGAAASSITEHQFLRFLQTLQEKHLLSNKALNRFDMTDKVSNIVGAAGQADVHVHKAVTLPNGTFKQSTWEEVQVVMKLTSTPYPSRFKEHFGQVATLVHDIWMHQPARIRIFACIIRGSNMKMLLFDRSGVCCSREFDINAKPDAFATVIVGCATMSPAASGMDTCIQTDPKVKKKKDDDPWVDCYVMADFHDSDTGEVTRSEPIYLRRLIWRQHKSICQGTACWSTLERLYVVKFSWAPEKIESEVELLLKAKACGVVGVVELVAWRTGIADIRSLRATLLEDGKYEVLRFEEKPSPPPARNTSNSELLRNTSWAQLPASSPIPPFDVATGGGGGGEEEEEEEEEGEEEEDDDDAHDGDKDSSSPQLNLVIKFFRPEGVSLCEATSVPKVLLTLRDTIRSTGSLYTKAGIIHRDISLNNIMMNHLPPNDYEGWHSLLIDFDNAKSVPLPGIDLENASADDPQPPSAENRGAADPPPEINNSDNMKATLITMCPEPLVAWSHGESYNHTVVHDLQGIYYVLMYFCGKVAWQSKFENIFYVRREKTKRIKNNEPRFFDKWDTGTYSKIAAAKISGLGNFTFRRLTDEFPRKFERVKLLCKELRDLLYETFTEGEFEGEHNIYIPETRFKELYHGMLNAFDKTIKAELGLPS